MNDNVPVHIYNTVKECIANNNIITTLWTVECYGINIIENIWLHIKRNQETRAKTTGRGGKLDLENKPSS